MPKPGLFHRSAMRSRRMFIVVAVCSTAAGGLVLFEAIEHLAAWAVAVALSLTAACVAAAWIGARRDVQEAQERVRTIELCVEVAGSLLLVLDRNAIVLSANRQTCLALEREIDDVVGRNWLEFSIPAEAVAATTEAYRYAVDNDEIQLVYENELIAATGERRQVTWYSVANRDRFGQITGMVCSGTDITEQRAAERAVERGRLELEALARLARKVASLDDARDAVIQGAMELVDARRVAIAEPADGHRDTLEYAAASDQNYCDLCVPADHSSGAGRAFATGLPQLCGTVQTDADSSMLSDATETVTELHQPIIGGTGVVGVLSVTWDRQIASAGSREVQLVGIIAHEAAVALRRRNSLADLERAALVDPLTGLANRRAFAAELPRALNRAATTGQTLAVIVMDLNEFKAVNDTLGHDIGDQLLADSAAAWSGALRTGDMLARIGGDEFTVLLPGCSQPELTDIADRLRTATPHAPGTSIGTALWNGTEPPASLIRRADIAQYADKALSKRGRNTIRL